MINDQRFFKPSSKKWLEEEEKTEDEIEKVKEDKINNQKIMQKLFEKNLKFAENFEFLELLDTGSESCAFKTLMRSNKKIILSKVIRKEKSKSNDKETYISMKLRDKNIINNYGFLNLIDNKYDCILMELAKYGNLRDFQLKVLKRRILSESFLCYITIQVLNALKYLHKCKIVHYDIKPQNIVINECLVIKLIDFSVSLDYSHYKKAKIELPFRGTNFYIPPEVLHSEKVEIKDLNKIDLYSLGVILYNLAFGVYPFDLKSEDSKDYDTIYEKVMKDWEVKDTKHDFSPSFIDFVKKLLERDIKKRINICEALDHYWVKGANILMEEQEKAFNASSFLIYLLTDNIINFNNYIKKEKNFFLSN